MTNTLIGIFDATQRRPWRSDRTFRVWVAGGALRGALVRETKHGPDLSDLLLGGALVGDLFAIVLFAVLLPLCLLIALLGSGRAKERRRRLSHLDPTTEEYLQWDEPNFRLRLSEVERVEFSEKLTWPHYAAPKGKMDVHLTNGETWHFTFPSAPDTGALQRDLEEAGFKTERRA